MFHHVARYIDSVVDNKLILITLLVKLGVAAAVASALARSRTFQQLLFAERRTRPQTAGLLAFLLVPLTLGVWVRTTVNNFLAADISFETIILSGLLVGPVWAMAGGIVLSAPAVYHHEYLALPFNAVLGLAAGILGRFVQKEEIWGFTPFIDLSLYRWVRRNLRQLRIDRQFLMLFVIVAFEIVREWLARNVPRPPAPRMLFALNTGVWGLQVLVWLCAPMVVGIALKVWNALRIELKLEEQKHLLLEARLDALQRQINPHFLFNTLNSIASLVRVKPELARQMTVKLANILRALLNDHDTYVPLSHELSFTDDYIDIEVVRFGADKLRVEKDIDPATLGVMVPSILLQPLVENSIKHGLEPRINGGTVTLRSRLQGNRVSIEVADDGVGIVASPESGLRRGGNGIGMQNVRERLEVLYGSQARFTVVSNPGRGTLVSIELPANLPD
ncbi:MAG TPA: histidine kinase [Terracidiphilus sp.]|jgi:two-component system LytT family sensor kinase